MNLVAWTLYAQAVLSVSEPLASAWRALTRNISRSLVALLRKWNA